MADKPQQEQAPGTKLEAPSTARETLSQSASSRRTLEGRILERIERKFSAEGEDVSKAEFDFYMFAQYRLSSSLSYQSLPSGGSTPEHRKQLRPATPNCIDGSDDAIKSNATSASLDSETHLRLFKAAPTEVIAGFDTCNTVLSPDNSPVVSPRDGRSTL